MYQDCLTCRFQAQVLAANREDVSNVRVRNPCCLGPQAYAREIEVSRAPNVIAKLLDTSKDDLAIRALRARLQQLCRCKIEDKPALTCIKKSR
jgi:hypothetical protein